MILIAQDISQQRSILKCVTQLLERPQETSWWTHVFLHARVTFPKKTWHRVTRFLLINILPPHVYLLSIGSHPGVARWWPPCAAQRVEAAGSVQTQWPKPFRINRRCTALKCRKTTWKYVNVNGHACKVTWFISLVCFVLFCYVCAQKITAIFAR